MSRSNYDKPFYVDVGTSIIAIRCASNHDVVVECDFAKCPQLIKFTEDTCDRMNREVEIRRPRRNCDVGTPDEQAERFYKFCQSRTSVIKGMCNPTCPLIGCVDLCHCFARWMAMPYEAKEGAAK